MSVYQKIYDVMCESEAVKKDMEVGTGNNSYKAVGEAAVLNVIKPLLKKHKLVLFPVKCVVDETHTEYQGKYGMSQRFLTKLVVDYKIVDVETGEFEILESIGYGTDTQDKGSGQAMTYAYKALIQKTFCLFSGEDTDNEHSEDKDKKSSYKAPTNTNETEPSNEINVSVQMLEKAILGAGKTVEGTIEAYNKKAAKKIDKLQFMPKVKKQEAYTYLMARQKKA